MINLAVIFGGRTAEHDVSIISGTQFIENVDKSKYNVLPIYISRKGEWYYGNQLADAKFFLNPDFSQKGIERVFLLPEAGSRALYKQGRFGMKAIGMIDVAAIAMHGMHGEDGTLQGFLELADIPYTSAGVTGSAVGMDKIVMKAAFKGLGIPVLDCIYFERTEYEQDAQAIIEKAEAAMSYPMIVKPANLGSSIGITKAKDAAGLKEGIEVAIHYDRRILVEPAIDDLTEINCAVVGLGSDAKTSLCERPITAKEVLDFSEKYLHKEGGSKGMKSLDRELPAKISKEKQEEIEHLALQIFKGLDMAGVVRIDFMIDNATDTLYANEVNTIPGSFAFYLYEPMGIKYSQLIDTLVENALKRSKQKAASQFSFDSEILKKAGAGTKRVK
ncbi:D-alanine--D-alanine ligase family protein [Christensenellaceae bacterium 44-20]